MRWIKSFQFTLQKNSIMRLLIVFLCLTLLVSTGCNNSSENEEKTEESSPVPKTDNEKLSYSLGILASSSVIEKLEQSKLTHLIVPEKMAKGIQDFVAGKEIEIEPKQAKENLNRFFRKLQEEGKIDDMQQKDKEVLSYSIGVDAIREIYGQLSGAGIDSIIDINIVVTAMRDYILGKKIHINAIDAKKMVSDYFVKANQANNEKMLTQFQGNKEEGIAYQEENKKKKGVKVTQSGLQLEVIKEGKGKQPKLGDTVEVHYTGTFIDGKKFDSSFDRNEPYVFIVDYNYPVISGWVEGAQLMKEGGKYRIVLPYELGYKDRPKGPINPFSTLVFEMEIISVNKVKK